MRVYESLKRTKHELKLTFKIEKIEGHKGNNCIKVEGVHEYTIANESEKEIPYRSEIYTDIGPYLLYDTDGKRGGFKSVQVNGEDKTPERISKSKELFLDVSPIPSKGNLHFKYHTYAYYRLVDRLIWTVQESSDPFTVEIINATGFHKNELLFWYNHDDRQMMDSRGLKRLGANNEYYVIEFSSPVQPYQGFEIFWNFEEAYFL